MASSTVNRTLPMHRSARSYLPVVLYLAFFAATLAAVSKLYLLPALDAARTASAAEKQRLAAQARLILAVVLFVLFAGLLLTFRIGRFFFPRPAAPRRRTEYSDAWTESARRMKVPPESQEDGDDVSEY